MVDYAMPKCQIYKDEKIFKDIMSCMWEYILMNAEIGSSFQKYFGWFQILWADDNWFSSIITLLQYPTN